ncbi:hypothetical protein KC723_01610 [Candidatus Kaiserbacteria bacterium]|nr:hypothetical protein [Candidatus Kaiserbacteria bacterium]
MSFFVVIIYILQSIAISLGVGASTLAIVNFFVAIADGHIDETERNMMGIVYVVLRVAMVAILFSAAYIGLYEYSIAGSSAMDIHTISQWVVIFILYFNAILMTAHIMPSTFGPAIQASSWYTLGIMTALLPIGKSVNSFNIFFAIYLCAIVFAVAIVNGIMWHIKVNKLARGISPKSKQPINHSVDQDSDDK